MATKKKRKAAVRYDGKHWRDAHGLFASPPRRARKAPQKLRRKPKATRPVQRKRRLPATLRSRGRGTPTKSEQAPKPAQRPQRPVKRKAVKRKLPKPAQHPQRPVKHKAVKRKPPKKRSVSGAGAGGLRVPKGMGWKAVPKKKQAKATKADFKRQELAADRMRFALRGAAAELATDHAVETAVTVHENRDGTIDGEIRIFNIPRALSTKNLLIHMEKSLWDLGKSPHRLPKEFWISVGALTDWSGRQDFENDYQRLLKAGYSKEEARKEAQKARSPMPRYKGLDRVGMWPQRASDIHINFISARKEVFGKNLTARHKPEQMLVRVYWNPWGKRPGKR